MRSVSFDMEMLATFESAMLAWYFPVPPCSNTIRVDCLLSATESVLLVPKAISESSVSVALSQLVNAIAAKTSRRHRRLAVLYIGVVIV